MARPFSCIAVSMSLRSTSSEPSNVTNFTRSRSSKLKITRLPTTPFCHGSSTTSIQRSSRKPVSHRRRKSSRMISSVSCVYGTHRFWDGRLRWFGISM